MEYDQIIRTATFFAPSTFIAAVAYATVFCILTQPANSAAAIHFGGRVVRRGHQRFYKTQLRQLDWVYYGSGSQETAKDIEKVNRMHANIWKQLPGTFSDLYEAHMSVISMGYFEQWMRKLVGSQNEMHHKVKVAWPQWGERVCDHFHTEPSDGRRSMALNFSRTFEEIKTFGLRFDTIACEEESTPELLQKGHETAEAFNSQFCELCCLQWLGRDVILTFTPPGSRRRQNLGEPHRPVSAVIKSLLKLFFDLSDELLPDPAKPNLPYVRERLLATNLNKTVKTIKMYRTKQDKSFIAVGLLALVLLPAIYFYINYRL
ncbi:hypothetical protein DM02DRAFT_685681 [Periconia macrospinosa]|uniref:ER-bound oxygenase mpaB/mpaB'/Rubber oxygenase catalytic domain-containing protein n=1 Tax=Periconia macrospinosa TaxID=97972 RepID=A0A2V1DHY4_9PLEO|nr:hypothetical protein DM02DRAFT_685681 [Periconia macrospinosa]